MSFGEPIFLFLAVLAPALLELMWSYGERQKANALARLGDQELVSRLRSQVSVSGFNWRRRLWQVGIVCLALALARPQWGEQESNLRTEGVQVMVALDISASMLAQDLSPDRLTRAKQSINDLMVRLEGDEVGLVLFSGASFVQFPLTSDYATARSFLNSANPGMISRPGTVIGEALQTAFGGFNPNQASQRVIVVMTDGEDHETNPVQVATELAQEGVVIYTIGFGSEQGVPIPQYDQLGRYVGNKMNSRGTEILTSLKPEVLEEVADVAGGRYFPATVTGREIDLLLGEIDRLEAGEIESRVQVELVERHYVFTAFGLLSFLLAELIPQRSRKQGVGGKEGEGKVENGKGKGKRGKGKGALVSLLAVGVLVTGCAAEQDGVGALEAGNGAFSAGEYETAIEEYEWARVEGLDSAEPLYNIGNAQYRQNMLPESQGNLAESAVLSDETLSVDNNFNLGNAHFLQSDYEGAIEAYKEALRINPDDADAKHNLELAFSQQEQQQQNQPEQEPPPEEQEQEQEEEEEQEQEEESQSEEEESEEEEEQDQTEEENQEPEEQEGEDEGESEPSEDEGGEDEQESEPELSEQGDSAPTAPTEITEEQALQLLEGVEQSTSTLQEQLQQYYNPSLPPPPLDKDY